MFASEIVLHFFEGIIIMLKRFAKTCVRFVVCNRQEVASSTGSGLFGTVCELSFANYACAAALMTIKCV